METSKGTPLTTEGTLTPPPPGLAKPRGNRTFTFNDDRRVLFFTVNRDLANQVSAIDDASAKGLEQVLAHFLKHPETTRITPLDAAGAGSNRRENWQAPLADKAVRSMGGRYSLRVGSGADSARLEKALMDDQLRVGDVYRPPVYRHVTRAAGAVTARRVTVTRGAVDPSDVAAAEAQKQWGLIQCGFPAIWKTLDVGSDAEPIAMIDIGNHHGHPEIANRIIYDDRTFEKASVADHASSVAAIICAQRNGGGLNGEDMDGCCSARVKLYNVWTRHHGLDHDAMCDALRSAIEQKLPVVNMSIWVERDDKELAGLLVECEKNDVVVVAAMGNSGDDQEFFPAADRSKTVIAVAATDALGNRCAHSSVGPHAFIAAPGENIFTVVGDGAYDRVSGTSYAAAFVTAAVWLAKRQRPDLTNQEVRDLLKVSVAKPGEPRSPELGYGRLDMGRLVVELAKIPPKPSKVTASTTR